ncbi:MAG: hypothetical protein KBD63_01635 [Bacteriovoracaceae bacterium]|nr:hypothetical protein [Bacteriovoracaceae bacterium]
MFILFFLLFNFFLSFSSAYASQYEVSSGHCPQLTSNDFVLQLVKSFEDENSLKFLKKIVVKNNLDKKNFLSSYKISYHPLKKKLMFILDCPIPIMQVQIYRENTEPYVGILAEDNKIYDAEYEKILKKEGLLDYDLPNLALPLGEQAEILQKKVTFFFKDIDLNFRKKISEIIFNDKQEMIMILASAKGPTSVFLGSDGWKEKMKQLPKIVSHSENQKHFSVIYMNGEKIVVK